MNKKLLAVAVGAALAAGPVLSAQADVKVKGILLNELVNVDGDTVDLVQQGDSNGMSRWYIDASEDLGNGLTAFGRVAFGITGALTNDGAENNRDNWVGIKGGFGAVTFGRQVPCYAGAGGSAWDPFVATFMQARRAGGMSGDTFGHNGFRDDLIGYATPKGSPIRVCAQLVMDESANQDGEYFVGLSWKGGPLEIIAATNNDPNEPDDLQNMKVGARFQSGGFTGFFQYEDVDQGGGIFANGNRINGVGDPASAVGANTLGEGNFMLVGLGYKFGSNMIHGNFGGFDADDAGSDVDYFALGVVHFLSKKTRVYAGYSNIDAKNVGETDMFGAGIRFDFG